MVLGGLGLEDPSSHLHLPPEAAPSLCEVWLAQWKGLNLRLGSDACQGVCFETELLCHWSVPPLVSRFRFPVSLQTLGQPVAPVTGSQSKNNF